MNEAIQIKLPPIELSAGLTEEWRKYYSEQKNNCAEKWLQEIYDFLFRWIDPETSIALNTSGSTGTPKKLTVQKSVLLFSANQTTAYFQFKENEKWLLCIPANFIGGQMILVRAILCKAEVWAISPKLKLTISQEYDFASMIPMQAEEYLNSELKIKRILIGGSSIPSKTEENLRQNSTTEFYASYGMTETVSHVALRKINGKNASHFFTPLKNILVGSDERGCLTIYHRNYSEHVLVTNDIAEFDTENNFRIIGRADHIINSGGLKIIPEEIEKILEKLFSQRILVIGIPDERTGEKPVLLIEGTELDASTLKLVKNFISENIEKNKQPKEIGFLEKFMETENGKVMRKETRDYFLNTRRTIL